MGHLARWRWLLAAFLLADLCYTGWQHAQQVVDGDLAGIVVPSDHYQTVLDHPLGTYAIRQDTTYAGVNRYVVHQSMYTYFRLAPTAFRQWMHPVEAVYAAAAFAKTIFHLGLAVILAFLVQRLGGWAPRDRLILMALVVPLMQTSGAFANTMALVEGAPTYAFFYAFPMVLFLFWGWYMHQLLQKRQKALHLPLAYVLAILLPFSGPLIPALAGVLGLVLVFACIHHWNTFRREALEPLAGPLLVFLALSGYSFFLNGFNIEGQSELSVWARYHLIPVGLWGLLTNKLGLSLLLISAVVMRLLLRSQPGRSSTIWSYLALFAVLYLVLLPLGGYRDYRPMVVRRDTLLPLLIILVAWWAHLGLALYRSTSGLRQKMVMGFLVSMAFLYTLSDLSGLRQNARQKAALYTIHASDHPIVIVPDDCRILAWDVVYDVQYATLPSQALQLWKIMKPGQVFVQIEAGD